MKLRSQPLEAGARVRVGIRAGDILLATEEPRGLSARNVIAGTVQRLEQEHGIVSAVVNCGGINFVVQLTLAAREALALKAGSNVWVVIKTHSCHLLR